MWTAPLRRSLSTSAIIQIQTQTLLHAGLQVSVGAQAVGRIQIQIQTQASMGAQAVAQVMAVRDPLC